MTAGLQLVPEVYDGHRLTFVELDGVLHVIAREVGKVLGYAEEGHAFISSIRGWAEDLRDGIHTRRADGDLLAMLKARLGTELVPSRSPSLLLLTERGLLRALMLAGGPVAPVVRDPEADLDAEHLRVRKATALLELSKAFRRSGRSRAVVDLALQESARLLLGDGVDVEALVERDVAGLSPAAIGVVLEAWRAELGDRALTLAELDQVEAPRLHAAITRYVGDRARLGYVFRGAAGVSVGGLRLVAEPARHGLRRWRVVA